MMNQQKPQPLQLTPEDLAKVTRRKNQVERTKVYSEDYVIAEMGYYFGWGGVEAIVYNRLTLDEAMKLIRGARKVWNGKLVDIASVVYTASVAAQSGKKAKSVMQKGLGNFIKEARVDS